MWSLAGILDNWYIIVIAVVVIFFVVPAIWYWLPILMVRKHDFEDSKDRLHTEDSHRKTLTTTIASFGFVVPIMIGAAQYVYTESGQQRQRDRQFSQDISTQFTKAMETFLQATKDKNRDLQIRAIHDLERAAMLSTETPEHFVIPLARFLVVKIREYAQEERVLVSSYCGRKMPSKRTGEPEKQADENARVSDAQARQLIEAAAGSLGRLRQRTEFTIRLNGYYLDRIDISSRPAENAIKTIFSNADFAGSHFRLSVMKDSKFDGVDFRDAEFAMPDFMSAIEQGQIKWGEEDDGDVHRCWIADLRGTSFKNADFRNAKLAGVDFRRADLAGAKFDGADITWADFRGAHNIMEKQLLSACVRKPAPDKRAFLNLDISACPE